MSTTDKSLRRLVEKWLGAASAQPVRVVLIQRSQSGRICRLCIEANCPSGPVTLFFFRHHDDSWHVFPPANRQPAMSIGRLAA